MVDFSDHREELLKILEAASWPIRERDIVLLEKEIRQAEAYIEQAEHLIEESQKKAEDSDVEDDNVSVASSGSSTTRSQVSDKEAGHVRLSLSQEPDKESEVGVKDEKSEEDEKESHRSSSAFLDWCAA